MHLGDIGCFSFYPGKNLGACGEGGAVVTKPGTPGDDQVAEGLGTSRAYRHVLRFNGRMEGIQAAVLEVKYLTCKP